MGERERERDGVVVSYRMRGISKDMESGGMGVMERE